jgi:hypothetical protein
VTPPGDFPEGLGAPGQPVPPRPLPPSAPLPSRAPQRPPSSALPSGMKRPRNGVAVTSFCIGILSLFFIPLFGGAWLLICGVLAFGLAVAALGPLRHLGRSNWMAVVGALLGLAAIWSGYHGIVNSRKLVRALNHALSTPVVDANAQRGRVRVLHCGAKDGKPFADGTVTNSATIEQTFRFSIAYKAADGGVHMTQGKYVNYVGPGQTVHWSLRGYTDFDPATCVVMAHPNF